MTTTTSSSSNDLSFKGDLKKEMAKYEADNSKFLSMLKLRTAENKSYPVIFSGEIVGSGISATEFGTGKNKKASYSIGLELDDDTRTMFNDILTLATQSVKSIWDDFEVIPPIKESGVFYLKLKTDPSGKSFSFKSNLNITPKKYAEVTESETLTFDGEVQMWVNYEDRKIGLSFIPKKLEFVE